MMIDLFDLARSEGEAHMCLFFRNACSNRRFRITARDVIYKLNKDSMNVVILNDVPSRYASTVCSLIDFMCRYHPEIKLDIKQEEWNAVITVQKRS